MKQLPIWRDPWVYRMAWRDGRRSKSSLMFATLSMTLGVAALVAITSFGATLQRAVFREAKALLGADLKIESRRPMGEETEALIQERLVGELGGIESRRVSFSTMARFDTGDTVRLVRIRAVRGDYPFYGELKTDPPEAARAYQGGREALVEDSLLMQAGAEVGDHVTIGRVEYRVAGRLLHIPGESAAQALFGPRVFIPLEHIDQELLALGSRVNYDSYLKFDESVDVAGLVEDLEPHFDEFALTEDTVEEEQENWGDAARDLQGFLGLVAFVAILLGGVGVGSGVHVTVQKKLASVAVLRCVGATSARVLAVFVVQALGFGLVATLLGAAIGVGVQQLLPSLIASFFPVEVEFRVETGAILVGISVGLCVSLFFALLPLLSVRRVAPLSALRAAYEPAGRMDPWRIALLVVLALGVVGFAWWLTGEWNVALGYGGATAGVFALLALTAWGLRVSVRRLLSPHWPYVLRQGLANLDRPHNQTRLLTFCLGFGVFLLLSLSLAQASLLGEFSRSQGEGQPNLVLFDIQDSQRDAVRELVEARGLPVKDLVPIVNMRLRAVQGRSVEDLRSDPDADVSDWVLNREYRSTYRDHLTETENLTDGEFVGRVEPGLDVVPVSLEQRQADRLRVELGDTLLFDVQGVLVQTRITSIREVEWRRARPNFFVVFPEGSLDEAPKFHVLLTRTADAAGSAELQRVAVTQFPNISAVDVSLILDLLDGVLGQISFVVRFMALFSVLTGAVVLAGAMVSSRLQRIGESVLLRTLGASRVQIRRIMICELLLLSVMATATGALLAVAGGLGLTQFVFEATFHFAVGPFLLAVGCVLLLTLVVGVLGTRGVTRRPPLEVLRTSGI